MRLQSKNEEIKDIKDIKGLDVEDEFIKILSDELSKSIDLEIMKKLKIDNKADKIKNILEKIKKYHE